MTECAIKKYVQEQAEESKKEDSRGTSLFYRRPVTMLAIPVFRYISNIGSLESML